MMRKLIEWAVYNPLITLLLAVGLAGFGLYAFLNINVEAYPDPAPAILEVVAQFPGGSSEDVERLVTIPLEVSLSGMPGLQSIRTKSLFGLSFLNMQFSYDTPYEKARQEVINRMAMADLPQGVTPSISPRSVIGEIFRYTLSNPSDPLGRPVYSINDLKALQDWTLVRDFRRLPGVADVVSFGGTVKRYEIHPDPDRLRRHGITLQKLEEAIAHSNANVGGDYLIQGETVQVVRGLGLLGRGQDSMQRALAMSDPVAARDQIREEERRRVCEVRQIVLTTTNNVPIRVEDVVEGGPARSGEELGREGVVVGFQTRLGRVMLSRSREGDDGARVWDDEDDAVQGLVMLRKGADTRPSLEAVRAKIEELNRTPGRLLPGVKIVPYYDRRDLINVTTETVRENLLTGMALVSIILLMFLGNVRTALIIALNIPLALLFAFSVLFLRGKSANFLSIGAVDFGIVVDSSVIMVENIYRRLSSGVETELPLRERIIRSGWEIERSLFFSTLIMVCALLPVFTMSGPEGQIFGPMADTYAFALSGAMILALTVSPVLCLLLFRHLKPGRDNILVRTIKRLYLRQLERFLDHRWLALGLFGLVTVATLGFAAPQLGREFMPELDEGNLWIRGIFPVNVSLEEVTAKAKLARSIMRKYPEVQLVATQLGRPDDGTDPTSFYNSEFFVPLKRKQDWPAVEMPDGWRPRTEPELIEAMSAELSRDLIGVNWNFSQAIRDMVFEVLSGVQGENSVKIIGPDLDELERLAQQVNNALAGVRGIQDLGPNRIMGQANLEFAIDRDKCAQWNVRVADVEHVIQTAVGGAPFTQRIEGEKSFDVTLRWPERLRESESAILEIPVDVIGHQVTEGPVAQLAGTPFSGPSTGISTIGTSHPMPTLTGSRVSGALINLSTTPQRRLRELVIPVGPDGERDPSGRFVRPGAVMIYRDQGSRMIAVKFGVRGRDLAGTVAEAQAKVAPLIKAPYRVEWSGEIRQMEQAERRLVIIIGVSLGLIFSLLYLALGSFLDVLVIGTSVAMMSLGGIWALVLTHTNFNISAAVGFISIFGVAVMDGLLLVSYFNQLRRQGLPLKEAILQGAEKRVRPITMTALTAAFGLLPAALSTRIGSQAQRPLAIVVVGGMLTALFLMRYLMPVLYSFYGHREPRGDGGGLAH